jgi:hypothetical protein
MAVLVDDGGDWTFVVVTNAVDSVGRLEVSRRLYAAAIKNENRTDQISRLMILGPDDPGASELLSESTEPAFGVYVDSFPEARAYVIWRAPIVRRALADAVRSELVDRLVATNYSVAEHPRLEVGWRADLVVGRAGPANPQAIALIEVVVADAKSWKSRLRDAAGMANLAGLPVVLVLVSSAPLPSDLLTRRGAIPVQVVDWTAAGPDAVLAALHDFDGI